MASERPPSRSERLLRSTLERNPPQAYISPNSSPRAHRRRHSHVPPSTTDSTSISADDDGDDQILRAAFLYRTAATAASPVHPHYHSQRHGQRTSHSPSPTRDYYSHGSHSRSRAASPSSHYHRGASPSPRRQPLQRSPASVDSQHGMTWTLQRHNSIPARRRSNATSSIELELQQSNGLPMTPHEQVLRARLERVLISGRVVDERDQSREHASRRRSRDDSVSPGWPWSENSLSASTPPKSSSSSDHGHGQYIINPAQTHHRSRSKTDPLTSPPPHLTSPRRGTTTTTPAPSSPYLIPKTSSSAQYHPAHRNNSNSSTWTPPLTADASPVLSEPEAHSLHGGEEAYDAKLLLTPPPTPPFWGTATATPAHTAYGGSTTATPGSNTKRPGVSMFRSRTHEPPGDSGLMTSPYLYRREEDGSVEQLALPLAAHHHGATFNARKASETCRMMEGYVSFAQVEGLGTPPDGVDDDDDDNVKEGEGAAGGKRGRVLNIGTWARKLFVGVATAQS